VERADRQSRLREAAQSPGEELPDRQQHLLQDNETSWFDWAVVDRHADVHRFVTLLNARRLLCDVEHEKERASLNEMLGRAQKAWMT
jgi:hypothetical protein